MNLQEDIDRIKEVMGLLNEQPKNQPLGFTGGINWYSANMDAKDSTIDKIESETKTNIPKNLNILQIFPKMDSDFFISFFEDIKSGVLTQKTVDNFKKSILTNLQKKANDKDLVNKVKTTAGNKLSMVKSIIAKPIINSAINKAFNSITTNYLVQGLLGSVNSQKNISSVDPKVVSNSNSVIPKLANLLSKDMEFKNNLSSIVYSFISKL